MPSAYIATIGPEIKSHGPNVLRDEVVALQRRYPDNITVSFDDCKAKKFPAARAEDVVYLVAHGEDPGHEEVNKPSMGDKDGAAIAAILRQIFKGFSAKKGQFSGHIVLEGCHTAVHMYRAMKETGSSLLEDVQAAMNKDAFFKDALTPEVTIAGYRGSNFTHANSSRYNSASIESPQERLRHNKEYPGNKITDENTTVNGEEAVVFRRWRQKG